MILRRLRAIQGPSRFGPVIFNYLPTSSHAIHIVYDPSSPRTWCAFEFSPADSQGLKKNLTSVNALPQRLKRVDDPGASWWPDFLKGNIDVARFHANGNGFDAYVVEEPDVQSRTDVVLFAIDWAKGRGCWDCACSWACYSARGQWQFPCAQGRVRCDGWSFE